MQECKNMVQMEIDNCKAEVRNDLVRLLPRVDNNEKDSGEFNDKNKKQLEIWAVETNNVGIKDNKLDKKVTGVEDKVNEIDRGSDQMIVGLNEHISYIKKKTNTMDVEVLQNKKEIENLA